MMFTPGLSAIARVHVHAGSHAGAGVAGARVFAAGDEFDAALRRLSIFSINAEMISEASPFVG